MSQLILVKSKRAKKPFLIQSAGINVYSLEEVLYYVYKASFVSGEDYMNPLFAAWVRSEIDNPDLSSVLMTMIKDKYTLKDFFVPIEKASGYLTLAECDVLSEKLSKFDYMSSLEVLKLHADSLLKTGQLLNAIRAYRRLLNDEALLKAQSHIAGDVWNNLGTAYAKLFDFDEACKCYARAYVLNHRLESFYEACDAAYLSGDKSLVEFLSNRFVASQTNLYNEIGRLEELYKKMETSNDSSFQSKRKAFTANYMAGVRC
ncbi:MAG: tetratricopeptide repeat protein [Lachnospiraceae bacterium]|nr:tetratricopeptide repeat protein [Lachnospiraceae bacterium]